jgi:hypothetical protein
MFWPSRISPRHQFDIVLVVRRFFRRCPLRFAACSAPGRPNKLQVAAVEIMLFMKCTFASEETMERKKGQRRRARNVRHATSCPVVRSSHLALLEQHVFLHDRVILAESQFAEQRTQKGQNRGQKEPR